MKPSKTVPAFPVPSRCSTRCSVPFKVILIVDSDDYIRSAIFREIEILKHLKCENIVGFYDVMESSRFYYIVQELCDTDLEKLMKKKEKL